MTTRVGYSRRAAAEAEEIEAYLAEHSPSAALRFREALERAEQQLEQFPNSGEPGIRPERAVLSLKTTSSRTGGAETTSRFSLSGTLADETPGSDPRSGRLSFLFGLGAGRAGILALGVGIAVDQLDDRHRRIVAVAEPGLDDPGVSAAPAGITLRQRGRQLRGH